MFNTVLIFVMVRLFETMKIITNELADEKSRVFLIYMCIRDAASPHNKRDAKLKDFTSNMINTYRKRCILNNKVDGMRKA